jgi:hypothetical protein
MMEQWNDGIMFRWNSSGGIVAWREADLVWVRE